MLQTVYSSTKIEVCRHVDIITPLTEVGRRHKLIPSAHAVDGDPALLKSEIKVNILLSVNGLALRLSIDSRHRGNCRLLVLD